MSAMFRSEDKLSVFHPNDGKHAGTLRLVQTSQKNAKGEWILSIPVWTWQGGPFGPQNGEGYWRALAPIAFIDLTSPDLPHITMQLQNSRWIYVTEHRPWFTHGDTIKRYDWNFGKARKDPFIWNCKVISSAT